MAGLTVTRRIGEQVHIGEGAAAVIVTVVDVDGVRVRLRFDLVGAAESVEVSAAGRLVVDVPRDGITVTVLHVSGTTVRLSIEAPPYLPISRNEHHQRGADGDDANG